MAWGKKGDRAQDGDCDSLWSDDGHSAHGTVTMRDVDGGGGLQHRLEHVAAVRGSGGQDGHLVERAKLGGGGLD